MRRNSVPMLGLLLALLPASAVWSKEPQGVPNRYTPGLDGRLVQIQNTIDGRAWSFWAYRNRGEYDLAISRQLADGTWTEPSFLGKADSISQVEPATLVDGVGTLYLAFALQESGQIQLTTLRTGTNDWSPAVTIASTDSRNLLPTLRIVGQQLVVAYRTESSVGVTVLPLAGGSQDGPGPTGIQDGPDIPPGQSGGITGGR